MLSRLDIDKRHSPDEVEKLMKIGFGGSSIDLKNVVTMILVDDFRDYMKSKGFRIFSPTDLSLVFGCTDEQALEVFNIFNTRLKRLSEFNITR